MSPSSPRRNVADLPRGASAATPFAFLLVLAACGGDVPAPAGAAGSVAGRGGSGQLAGVGGASSGGSGAPGGSHAGGQPPDGDGSAGGAGGQVSGGAGAGQIVSCADAALPADANDAGADDAGAAGDRRACAPCEASAQCAAGLECGRPESGVCSVAFCVDPYETTECCAGTGGGVLCAVVDGSRSAAKRCPAQEPVQASACERQGRCPYGAPPFQTPCECVAGAWQCHPCPASPPTGDCPAGAGQLCAYGDVQCSCQTSNPQDPGSWHCNSCPATPPAGNCATNDYCGYAPGMACVCASSRTWGCFGPLAALAPSAGG